MTAHLDVLPKFKQWGLHDVAELEGLGFNVEAVAGNLLQPLPVPLQHGLVGHHLQQRARLVEVVDPFLEFVECRPLLEGFRELATPEGGKGQYVYSLHRVAVNVGECRERLFDQLTNISMHSM